jgi:V/A-type H+/Na+-transporting ATPase subunit C
MDRVSSRSRRVLHGFTYTHMRSDYAYITGKIKQLETGLPNEVDFDRMINAPDAAKAFEVLNDTDYANNLLGVEVENFNYALHEDWRELRKFLKNSVPDKKLLDILYLREDFNNLKIVLKQHLQTKPLADVRVTDAGSVSQADWLSYFQADERSNLNEFWHEVMKQILAQVGKSLDPQLIDREVDKIYFKTYKELALKLNNDFIIKLVEIEIDVMNVKSLIRARRLKRDAAWLTQQLADGGTIPLKDIGSWLELDFSEIVQHLRHNLPFSIWQEIDKEHAKSPAELIEKAMYTWRRRYLLRANFVAYGPEHVIKYFYAKIRAMINVRVAMMGKINNLAPEEIKARIRL